MKPQFIRVLIATILCAAFFASPLRAQEVVAMGAKSMSQGEYSSFYMELPSNNTKLAADEWKALLKDYKGKTKFNKKSEELFTDDVSIADISDNTVDVYARIEGNGITVWYDLGGAYLDPAVHSDKVPGVKHMLFIYYNSLAKELAAENVKSRESELKDLEKDLKRLEKDEDDLNDEIRKAKAAIENAEKGLVENATMQGQKKEEISGKEEEVKKAKSHESVLKKKKFQ